MRLSWSCLKRIRLRFDSGLWRSILTGYISVRMLQVSPLLRQLQLVRTMRLTCLRYVIRKNAALKPVVPISQFQYKEPVLLARTAFALPQPPSSGSELPRSLPLRTSITDTVRARIESLPEYPAVEGTAWTVSLLLLLLAARTS